MPVHLLVLPRRQATTLSQSELPWTYWICLHWPRLLRQDLDISYEATMLDKRRLHFWVVVPGWIHAVVLNGFELRFCLCSLRFWWTDMRPSQLSWRLKDFTYKHNPVEQWPWIRVIPFVLVDIHIWMQHDATAWIQDNKSIQELLFIFDSPESTATRTHRDEFSPQAKVQWWYLPWNVVKLALRPEVGTLDPSNKWNQNIAVKREEFGSSSCHPSLVVNHCTGTDFDGFVQEKIMVDNLQVFLNFWSSFVSSIGTIAWFSAKRQGFEKKHR